MKRRAIAVPSSSGMLNRAKLSLPSPVHRDRSWIQFLLAKTAPMAWTPRQQQGQNLGTRATLSDIGQTVAENFAVQIEKGTSFLSALS